MNEWASSLKIKTVTDWNMLESQDVNRNDFLKSQVYLG